VVRALVGLGAGASAIGLVVSSPASAIAPSTLSLPFAESMTGPTLSDPNWLLSGTATLTGTAIEPGMMQLTPASGGLGSAILNTPIDTSETFTIDFDYAINGDADGLSMFLIDGAETSPAPGAGGGFLGYATNGVTPGATSGYVGVGFTEYYGAPGGPGIRLVGSGSGTAGYSQIAFKSEYQLGASVTTNNGHARAIFDHGVVTLDIASGRIFDHVDLTAVVGQAALPPTVKLGFAGATGGLVATHQIRNVSLGLQSDTLHVAPSFTVNSQTGELSISADLTNVGLAAVPDAQLETSSTGTAAFGPDWTCVAVASATCPEVTTGPIGGISLPAGDGQVTVTQQVTGAVRGDSVTFNLSSASDPTRPRTEVLQLSYPWLYAEGGNVPWNSSANVIPISRIPDGWSIESPSADNGTVTVSTDGSSLLYAPDADYVGPDMVRFSARNGQMLATNYTTEVTVLANARPTATWTTPTSVGHGSTIEIPLILADIDDDTVIVDESWTDSGGCAEVVDATMTYNPSCEGDFTGKDTVNFTIFDGYYYVDFEFNIEVVGPTATTAAATVQEGKSVIIPVTISDPSGHTPTLVNPDTEISDLRTRAFGPFEPESHGTYTVEGSNLVYTPNEGFVGDDTIQYYLLDDNGQPDNPWSSSSFGPFEAAVTVLANHAPSATAAAASVEAGSSVTIPVTLADADGDAVELVAAEALHGGVVISGSNLVYTPTAGYVGPDEISFSFADYLTGGDDVVAVTVRPLNSAPTPPADEDTTPEISGTADDDLSFVIEGVTDADSDTLSVDVTTQPAHGTVSFEDVTTARADLRAAAIGVNGVRVVYMPNAGFSGADSFTYRVSDGRGGSYSRTVAVNVLAAAAAPAAPVAPAAPAAPARPASGRLPATGGDAGMLLGLATAGLLAGLGLLGISRRKAAR
jgi:Bacterial Ig domain/Bacterial lectin